MFWQSLFLVFPSQDVRIQFSGEVLWCCQVHALHGLSYWNSFRIHFCSNSLLSVAERGTVLPNLQNLSFNFLYRQASHWPLALYLGVSRFFKYSWGKRKQEGERPVLLQAVFSYILLVETVSVWPLIGRRSSSAGEFKKFPFCSLSGRRVTSLSLKILW